AGCPSTGSRRRFAATTAAGRCTSAARAARSASRPIRSGTWILPARRSMRTSTSVLALVLAAVLAPVASAPPTRIVVPAGFRVTRYASGLEHPTAMAWGPDARLYVTEDTGLLVAARPGFRKPTVVVRGLRTPLGLV